MSDMQAMPQNYAVGRYQDAPSTVHPLENLRDRLMQAERALLDLAEGVSSKANQLIGPEPKAQAIEAGGPPPHPPGLLHQVDSAVGRVELAISRLHEQLIRLP